MVIIKIEVEETNLEDLIVLGEDKLTPITIKFPTKDGRVLHAKAWIKQLTLKEVKNIDIMSSNYLKTALEVLKVALFKESKIPYTTDELLKLPVGVVTAISEKVLEISGVDMDDALKDF